MKTTRLVTFLCFSILALSFVACGNGEKEHSHEQTKVSSKTEAMAERKLRPFEILIDWQAEPTYLGFYYAKAIGAYEELGLDVTIVQSWGANEAAIAIAAGKYVIGSCSGGATAIARSKGADLVSTAVLYHSLPTVVFGLKSSGIESIHDLEGKKIGIYPKSITNNEFEAFIRLNKLRRDSIEVFSINGPDLPLVLTGKVDGLLNYLELSPTILSLKEPTYSFLLDEYGVRGYGLNIITSREAFDKDPELINGITAAALKGYRAGCQDQDAAVKAFLKEFPDKDPEYVRISWAKVCDFIGGDYGSQTVEGWQQTIDLYTSVGLIEKPLTPKDIMP